MKLPKIAVNKPIFTVMIFLAILLFGIVSRTMLPVDVLPEIEYPTLTVITIYPGASASELEQQVSKVLERVLAGVNNLKSIKSTSKENVSLVSLEFAWNTNLDEAASDARDAIEFVKMKLPDDATSPIIYKFNSSVLPVLIYAIEADESYGGLDKIIENKIANRLKKLPGVASIVTIGQPTREVKIELNPHKLNSYHLTPAQIAQILRMENITIPGGNVKIADKDLALRIPGEVTSLEEIENIALTSLGNSIIRVRDVATVRDDFVEKDIIAHTIGKKAVAIMVQKQSGSNTSTVAKLVQAEMGNIQKILPKDVQITEVQNSAELVDHSIKNLSTTIMWAAVFVILVVLFFLREWRSSLIIILTIPFSLIVAFIFMFVADFTVNIFSLMSLAIAIGMVVDNAIVVFENITQHVENGSKPHEAAIFGAGEMGMAISASTLTTIAVFLPMVFIGGLVGILFKQLALLTSITLIASLFTALTLTPMLASKLLKRGRQTTKKHGHLFKASERIFTTVEDVYTRVLKWAVTHRGMVISIAIILFIVSLGVGKMIGSDYIPEFDAGDINTIIELEVGTRVEETERVAKKVEAIYQEVVPDMRSMYSIIGQTEEGFLSAVGFSEGKNIATIGCKLVLPDKRDYTSKEIADQLRKRIAEIPEIEHFRVTGGSILGAALMGNEKPIEIKIMGTDFDKINATARTIETALRSQPNLTNIGTSIDKGKLELQIRINRDKAQALGLNTAIIAGTIRQSIYGAEASEFKEAGEEYNITVRYAPEFRNSIKELENISLTTMRGQTVSLRSIADISTGYGPLNIKRESQQRVVVVEADLNKVSLGTAVKEVQELLVTIDHPDDVLVELSGQVDSQKESFGSLYLLFGLGLALVYMVMASQFESLKDPLIVMFAIPLSIIGVIWAFVITGISLSVVTFIGIIMLLGIVVNNGIVLVDYTNLLRARGKSLLEAVIAAGHSRMRPVLMTAFTTMFGMLPLAVSTGMGSEMWKPLGITVIGGLFVSTLITLILIPVLYIVAHKKELHLPKGREK